MGAATALEPSVAPLGRCCLGPSFAVWCASPDLVGAVQWGELDDQGVRDMNEMLDFLQRTDLAATGRVLIDCQGIERVDGDALLQLATRARRGEPGWSPRMERYVVVVPAGLSGILLAGALQTRSPGPQVRCVDDLDAAFELLDHPAARTAHEAASDLAAGVNGRPPVLRRLRAHLCERLADASLANAAAALGQSPRTLQRNLAALSTSFGDELRRARVAAAEELLLHSDLKIDAVAARVGLGTSSRLSATLRRERSATASQLRARR